MKLRENWESRRVAFVLGVRDMKVRYKQSFLGPLWLFIQPLGLLVGFIFVFNGVTKVDTGGVPYLVFALVGLTVWTYIQMAVTQGAMAQVLNRDLIRRLTCPRVAFSNGSMIGALPGPAVMVVVTVVAVAATNGLPLQVLLLPVLTVWALAMAWGLVLGLSAMTARYRDIWGILPFLFQAGAFLSPVAYPASAAPAGTEQLLNLNPVTGLLETWRWALLGSSPDVTAIFISLAWTVALMVAGWQVFARMEVGFADYI